MTKNKVGRKTGWAKRGEKGGRPKGSTKENKKIYINCTISGLQEEIDLLKQRAKEKNKTVSRFVLDNLK